MVRIIKNRVVLSALALAASSVALSDPFSAPVKVISVRPHLNGNIYVQLASPVLCNAEVFMLESGQPAFSEMYSAVLAAAMSGSHIAIEARLATGCTGWGTKVESVVVLPDLSPANLSQALQSQRRVSGEVEESQ